MTRPHDDDNEPFLPDFCALPAVFSIVLLAQLFAFILVLAPAEPATDFWSALATTSLFMQWVALWGALWLCAIRRQFRRFSPIVVGGIAWAGLVGLVALFSEAAWRVFGEAGLPALTDHGSFLLRNVAIGALVSGLALRYFYVLHQWKQRQRSESEARIQALQARIRPHFLFNSMNTLASLTRTDPERAEAGIEDLADLFRASLGDARQPITLAEELALARRYLHMEGLRLGERLRVVWQIDAPEATRLPALTLQPLLENAVYHGIEPLLEGGTISVSAWCEGAQVQVRVVNPLPPRDDGAHHRGNRMALENIDARLQALFGHQAGLTVEETPEQYQVTLSVPAAGAAST